MFIVSTNKRIFHFILTKKSEIDEHFFIKNQKKKTIYEQSIVQYPKNQIFMNSSNFFGSHQ